MADSKKPLPFVALLRGINVGGTRRVPMADLRELAEEIGWHDVRTYIQSGNLVFRTSDTVGSAGAALAEAIEQRFGFAVPVIVREGAEWLRLAGGSPFPEAETERANLLHLALADRQPTKAALAELEPYCRAGERVSVHADALWIDYHAGVARSKLTPAVMDRVLGSPVTARNWKTAQAIAALVRDG